MNLSENKKTQLGIFDKIEMFQKVENNVKQGRFEEFVKVVGYCKEVEDANGNTFMLSIEEQEEILSDIFKTVFFDPDKKQFLTIDRDYNSKRYCETDLLFYLADTKYMSSKIVIEVQETKTRTKTKEVELVNIKRAIQTIKIENQIEKVNYSLDMFNENKISKDGKTLTIRRNSLDIRMPDSINKEDYDLAYKIIEDWKKHNPFAEKFVEMIVSSMFSSDRKTAYFYFIVSSNFGKSFWMEVFDKLNLNCEVDYTSMLAARADISPEEVFGKMFTYHDEFNYIPKEMKNMTHSAQISPKGRMRVKVPMFAKVMLSAEVSSSVQGFVDTQISNRITLLDLKKQGSLLDRPILKEGVSLDYYSLVLQNWYYVLIKEELESYTKLNMNQASLKASAVLKELHKKYRINESEDLMNNLSGFLEEKMQNIYLSSQSKYNKTEFNVDYKYSEYLYMSKDKKNDLTNIYISSPLEFFLLILEESNDKNFKATSKYKKDKFEELMGVDIKEQYHPLIKRSRKCMKLTNKDIGL